MAFEIYYSDLTPAAQKEFLDFMRIDDPADGNFDVFPITAIDEPDRDVFEMKLYSPLTVRVDEKDYDNFCGSNELPSMDPWYASCFEHEITEHFEAELSMNDSEKEFGLMAYYSYYDEVKKNVRSIRVSGEVVDGRLMGVATLEMYDNLSPEGINMLKDYLVGQYADGFGEGAEQRPVKTPAGDLYVSLWSSDKSYSIQTEDEMRNKKISRGDSR